MSRRWHTPPTQSKEQEEEEEQSEIELSDSDSSEDDNGFMLKIKTLMGTKIFVYTYSSDTVELLKTRVCFQEGIPIEDQTLTMFSSSKSPLPNYQTLEELGISETSTLLLIVNITSGLPFAGRRSLPMPSLFPGLDTIHSNISEQSTGVKFPRIQGAEGSQNIQNLQNLPDGLVVLSSKDDQRVLLVFSRRNLDKDNPSLKLKSSRRTGRKTGNDMGSNTMKDEDFHEKQMERIRENAKTLKKMNEIREKILSKSKNSNKLPIIQNVNTAGDVPSKENVSQQRCNIKERIERNSSSSVLSLNRLKAEIYLYSRRDQIKGGVPYTINQLMEYTKTKLKILLEDKGNSAWSTKSHYLTPTVVENRRLKAELKKSNRTHRSESKDKENGHRIVSTRSIRSIVEPDEIIIMSARKDLPRMTDRLVSARLSSRPGSVLKPVLTKAQTVQRCAQCRKRLGLVCRYECRCGKLFCAIHRHAETHCCTYDYKTEGKKLLRQKNPMVEPTKLPDF